MKATEQSYTPHPTVKILPYVYDVKSWLAPHIEDLHGHTQPHCFKFTRDREGCAVMHFKNWSSDLWSSECLNLLKVRIM